MRARDRIILPRGRRALFDVYMFVDWSAACRRSEREEENAIWSCEATWVNGALEVVDPIHHPTRDRATDHMRRRLLHHVSADRRVLIGFDFPYGYPNGFWGCLGGDSRVPDWRGIWERLTAAIEDDENNQNNRFVVASDLNLACGHPPGPFWGCPRKCRPCDGYDNGRCPTPHLRRGQEGHLDGLDGLANWRVVEERLRERHDRHRQPKSVWQLIGGVTVGSQSLVGIPRLWQLRLDESLANHSRVWPFETGWQALEEQRPLVLHAEVWPSVVDVDLRLHSVKDAAQVLSLVIRAATDDAQGILGSAFEKPEWLSADQDEAVRTSEGWILWAKELPPMQSRRRRRQQIPPAAGAKINAAGQPAAEVRGGRHLEQNSWVYFANPEGVTAETTRALTIDHGWIWRSVHNSNRAAMANVAHLQPGQRIYLHYTGGRRPDLLASGVMHEPGEDMEAVGTTRAGMPVPVFRFWTSRDGAPPQYPNDPHYHRLTGICLTPDGRTVTSGLIERPKGNNALWRLINCRRRVKVDGRAGLLIDRQRLGEVTTWTVLLDGEGDYQSVQSPPAVVECAVER